ncbi:MAG: type IV pilus assembly protein PilM, partial [Planctomycetota bacterium]
MADFIVLPHKKVLSTPDLDRDEALRVAVGALVSQYDLSKARIAISAAGHEAFIRFAKLPPVEPKKVGSIVKFEAAQQIPFPLEEVEWDYQTFVREDSPDIEVGIFAMTRERVQRRLDLCADAGLRVDVLNLSPISVFNALAYDLPIAADSPGTAIIDIGTTATDLIVADRGRVWVRTFPIGGHAFTEAIVGAFKLPYGKAERLKREAEQSKHKRHIFQSMRPVFTDLAQEVQRSLSFYTQLQPDAKITRVIGIGSTFRLIGLRKYLSQQLQADVLRGDRFRRLAVEGPAEADFQSASLNFATAYGLALQGLGEAAIDANLVPTEVIRAAMWKRKTPVFVTAAALSIAAGAATFVGPTLTAARVESAKRDPAVREVQQVKSTGSRLRSAWQEISQKTQVGFMAENVLRLFERRDLFAHLVRDTAEMIATAPPTEPGGFSVQSVRFDYETPSGASPRWIEPRAQDGGGRDRGGRGARGRRGAGDDQAERIDRRFGAFLVTLVVESGHEDRIAQVDRTILRWLREHAERDSAPYTIIPPAAEAVGIEQARPPGAGP